MSRCVLRVFATSRLATRHRFSTQAQLRDSDDANHNGQQNVEELLSKPTWSVASLLPPKEAQHESPSISAKQLHHLLRLSALPAPKDAEEEASMIATLSSQLHFVKEIQKVDTQGVRPLESLRDETSAGAREAELGLDALKAALNQEEIRGKHHRRIRRKDPLQSSKATWDPLETASKTVGRFFVVEGGKNG